MATEPRKTAPELGNEIGSRIATALLHCLVSPNVVDTNHEPANMVDALADIAAATNRVADGLESVAAALDRHGTAGRGS